MSDQKQMLHKKLHISHAHILKNNFVQKLEAGIFKVRL